MIEEKKKSIKLKLNLSDDLVRYYFFEGSLINNAYNSESDKINIIFKDGSMCDIAEAADTLNIKILSKPVEKYYICFPKFQ
jgi:hypothetical protein